MHSSFYLEAKSRLISIFFFILGNEGKHYYTESYPELDLHACPFRKTLACILSKLITFFLKADKKYTVDRIKLYSPFFMKQNDSFSSFYLSWSAQTALCNLTPGQESDTQKGLFIGRKSDVDFQQQLMKAKADLDQTQKLALESKKGAKTSEQFQN